MGFVPAIILRNPRYAALLGVVLLATILLLSPARFTSDNAVAVANVGVNAEAYAKATPGAWVKEAVREEEERYALMLKDRAAMVRKYGPTPDRVQA